jgi:thiosulfate/3-mercaptopyruvate sulfurtransferase
MTCSQARLALALMVGMLGWSSFARGAAPEKPLLLGVDELAARLDEAGLRLLDARKREEYDKGHIPGAVWLDTAALQKRSGEPGALEDGGRWNAWIAPLGIGPDTTVIVYDANRQLDAARAWWLLRYLGVERSGLLDGGFKAWEAAGKPVTTTTPQVAERAFPVALQPDRLARRQDVQTALEAKDSRIVDARSVEEFTGATKRAKRGGRIPGACHLEWNTLVDAQGRFLPEAELRERLAAAGLTPGQPVITHCQSGGRASVNAFVFERLGIPARNYYASWNDWGNQDDTPIETGP